MSVDYDKLWNNFWGDMQKYGPIHRHQRRILKDLIKELDFKSVLDIGCGEGSNLFFLSKNFPNIKEMCGIEVSAKSLEQVKELLPIIEVHRIDVQKECLEREYDLVYCCDVIEHVSDDETFLKNVYKMTGKYFAIGTLQGRMRNFERDIGHVRNYRSGELEDKVMKASFKVLRVVQWGWPFYSPLYRDLLNRKSCQQQTMGRIGIIRKAICHILYSIFTLNMSTKGDIIWLLCRK